MNRASEHEFSPSFFSILCLFWTSDFAAMCSHYLCLQMKQPPPPRPLGRSPSSPLLVSPLLLLPTLNQGRRRRRRQTNDLLPRPTRCCPPPSFQKPALPPFHKISNPPPYLHLRTVERLPPSLSTHTCDCPSMYVAKATFIHCVNALRSTYTTDDDSREMAQSSSASVLPPSADTTCGYVLCSCMCGVGVSLTDRGEKGGGVLVEHKLTK